MNDQRHALLVVGDAEAISLVAIDAERLVLDHALEVHRVHVRNHHDAALALALELGMHHRADLLGRVVKPVDVGRRQDLDLATQRAQLARDVLGDLLGAFHVLAAGFDMHQVFQRIEIGLLLLLRQLVDIGLRCGLCGECGGGNGQSGQRLAGKGGGAVVHVLVSP